MSSLLNRLAADWRAAEALQTAATSGHLIEVGGQLFATSIPPLLVAWMNKDGLQVSRYHASGASLERVGSYYRVADLELLKADASAIGMTVSTFYANLAGFPSILIPEAGEHDPFALSVRNIGENVLRGWRRSRPSSMDEEGILRLMALRDLVDAARKEPVDNLFWDGGYRDWLQPLANEVGDPVWYEGWHWHHRVLVNLFRTRTLRETGMGLDPAQLAAI